MKNALRLPALFLLFFILSCAILAGLGLLELRVEGSGEAPETARALAAAGVVAVLRETLPIAVLISLVLVLFPLYRRPGNRFFSFLLPLAASFAVLAFGTQALRGLQAPKAPAPTAARYLLPRQFQEFGGSLVYAEAVERTSLAKVVEYRRERSGAKLRYEGAARVELRSGEVRLEAEGLSLAAAARPAYSARDAGERDQPFLASLFRDIGGLNRELEERCRASRSGFYFTCFALVFSFFAAGLFFRVSRWPLANVLLAFLVMRGYLALFRFLREGIADEAAKLIANRALVQYLPEVILLAAGLLFLLIDLLFFRFDRWQREMGGA